MAINPIIENAKWMNRSFPVCTTCAVEYDWSIDYGNDESEFVILSGSAPPGVELPPRCEYCNVKALPGDRYCVGCGAPT